MQIFAKHKITAADEFTQAEPSMCSKRDSSKRPFLILVAILLNLPYCALYCLRYYWQHCYIYLDLSLCKYNPQGTNKLNNWIIEFIFFFSILCCSFEFASKLFSLVYLRLECENICNHFLSSYLICFILIYIVRQFFIFFFISILLAKLYTFI